MAEQYQNITDGKVLLNNRPLNITSTQNYTIGKNDLMISSLIKHEVVDNGFDNNCAVVSKSVNQQQVLHSSGRNLSGSSGSTSLINNAGSNSPKMGSRRIFTPQFKLQVLESYRNDNDCKGNQRATARKYNIHRRQIQKWLQCESNLRSSVASINHSNMKHQFHNVSHDQQLLSHHQLKLSVEAGSNFIHHDNLSPQDQALESSRQSVLLNAITVPTVQPMHTGVAATVSTSSTQGALAAANLAAVVAAAAVAGAAGAMAVAGTTSTNNSTVTPIRPTAIGGSNSSIASPLALLHNTHQPLQQHQQYSMSYTHTPVNVPVSLPILTHISPPHVRRQYENFTSDHTHALTHGQFMPSYCLPVTVLSSAGISAANGSSASNTETTSNKKTEYNSREDMCAAIKTTNTATLPTKCYVSSSEFISNSPRIFEERRKANINDAVEKSSYMLRPSTGLLVTPMDLSMGHRHQDQSAFIVNTHHNISQLFEHSTSIKNSSIINALPSNSAVVDLTFRKRKGITSNNQDEPAEKCPKLDTIGRESSDELNKDKSPAAKPIKLFKPYLLDNDDVKEPLEHKQPSAFSSYDTKNDSQKRESIIWSNHSSPIIKNNHQEIDRSNFQSPSVEQYTFQSNYSNFSEYKSISPISALSPLSVPTLSPLCFRCPKGSPVSGYESSSSTYSESSFKSESFDLAHKQSLRLNVKMESIYDSESLRQKNVQRWLDQDSNDRQANHSSISVYA